MLLSRGDYSTTIYIWFDCGHGCGSYHKIEPGKYVNHKDATGYVQACTPRSAATFVAGPDDNMLHRENGSVHVDSGGEVRFKLQTRTFGGGVYEAAVHWDVYLADNDLYKSVDHLLEYAEGTDSAPYCWSGTA